MVGATGLAAYAGYETGGLGGAEISALVPAFVGTLFGQRKDNLVAVTEDAAEQAGMDNADVAAWLNADERHVGFFAETLEAAWSTLDKHKLHALSYVLADGFQDDARLDVDQLVVRALRELEPAHVRVLDLMATTGTSSRATVRGSLPELRDGLEAIFAGLERTGCLGASVFPSDGPLPLAVTDFGRTCLEVLRKANQKHPAR
jgi:hypothetical protein